MVDAPVWLFILYSIFNDIRDTWLTFMLSAFSWVVRVSFHQKHVYVSDLSTFSAHADRKYTQIYPCQRKVHGAKLSANNWYDRRLSSYLRSNRRASVKDWKQSLSVCNLVCKSFNLGRSNLMECVCRHLWRLALTYPIYSNLFVARKATVKVYYMR